MASPSRTHAFNLARTLLFYAQDGLCPLCGEQLDPRRASFDHVFPISQNRNTSQLGNMLIAHHQCNMDKGAAPPTPCERLFLQATNRRIGLPEFKTYMWDDAAALPEKPGSCMRRKHGTGSAHASHPQRLRKNRPRDD